VLPYASQGAVVQHRRRSGVDTRAVDHGGRFRRALSGAWLKQIFGPDAGFLGGTVAAAVATFFIFLPASIFMLAGGLMVEAGWLAHILKSLIAAAAFLRHFYGARRPTSL
jgi:chromate transporter